MKKTIKNETYVSLEYNYSFEELAIGDMFIMQGDESKGIYMKTTTVTDVMGERNAIQLNSGRHWTIDEECSVAWVEKAVIICNDEELK